MSSVLISYAPDDERFAQRLHDDLRHAGVQVVSDTTTIALDEIVTTIAAVIMVMSPASINDNRIHQITDFARDHELPVVLIQARYSPVPPAIALLPQVDMSTEARYQTFLPGVVDVLLNEGDINTIVVPPYMRVHDARNLSEADISRYMGVLSLIAAPRSGQRGNSAPQEYRNSTHQWQQLSTEIAARSIDEMDSVLLSRVMPPTFEQLDVMSRADYRIVHLSCPSVDNALLFEDEWERESYVYPQYLVSIFQNSPAEMLILHGELPEVDAEILLEETALQALLLISPSVDTASAAHLLGHVFARLRASESISTAFYNALEDSMVAGDGFQLMFAPGVSEARIVLPTDERSAQGSLINDGMPAQHNVPMLTNFVGRRASLEELAREIASSDYRQIAIYGEHEAGKSWLAAEYVAQQGWRYPDGILWVRISAQSKSEDIIGQLLGMLELPPTTNWNTLREILRECSMLLVLDQLDEWSDPLEIGELADFIARLDPIGGTRVLLTAWGPVQPITFTSGTEENIVHPLTQDEARILVEQYSNRYELDDIFAAPGAINAFAEVTKYEPWLIREAIQLVERSGLSEGLQAVQELTTDVADPFEAHMLNQLETLRAAEIDALRRMQGLKDGISLSLLQELVPDIEPETIRTLLQMDMLRQDGTLYRLPQVIRTYLLQYLPLSDAEQDATDAIVIQYMLKGLE